MEIAIIFKERTKEELGKVWGTEIQRKGQRGRKGSITEICENRKREKGGMEERKWERDAGRCLVPGSLQTCGESVTDLRSSGKCLIFGRQDCCIDGMVGRQREAKSEAHIAELMMQTAG